MLSYFFIYLNILYIYITHIYLYFISYLLAITVPVVSPMQSCFHSYIALGTELCVKLEENKIPSCRKGPVFFCSPELSVGPAGCWSRELWGTRAQLQLLWNHRLHCSLLTGTEWFLPFFFTTSVACLCGRQSLCMHGSVPVTSQYIIEQFLPLSTNAFESGVNALQ